SPGEAGEVGGSRKSEDAAGADAIREQPRFSDGRDPLSTPVRRLSGGRGGSPATRARRGKSTQAEVGSRQTRRELTRSANSPGSRTGATRWARRCADSRAVWGVVPQPEQGEGNHHSRKAVVGRRGCR